MISEFRKRWAWLRGLQDRRRARQMAEAVNETADRLWGRR